MFKKPLAVIILALALALLTVSAAGAEIGKFNLRTQAAFLLSRKTGLNFDTLQPVGQVGRARYPLLGLVVYEFKFVNPDGATYVIAVNKRGGEVSIGKLDAAEKALADSRYGRLDPALADSLADLDPAQRLDVVIWANMPAEEPAPVNRPAIDAPFDAQAWAAAESALSAERMAQVAAVTAPLTDELRARGFDPLASEMAPLVNVNLPVRDLLEMADRPEVERIYPSYPVGNEMDISRQVIGSNKVNDLGITGQGAKVAVVEYGGMVPTANPYLTNITRDNRYHCPVDWHVTGIAGIIRSTHPLYRGVAPETSLWVGCGFSDAELQDMTARGNTWGADTFSLSWYSGNNHAPGALDRFYDGVMFYYHDLVVKSAGNRGGMDNWVTPPGLGYNTLAVGSFDTSRTVKVNDDFVAFYSSWRDPLSLHNDREKPEVVAPGSTIYSTLTTRPWVGGIGSGTSFAAPMVAGETALLYQRNPALTAWPEATKAIIMATAIRNKGGATRLSEKDGAGGIWVPQADLVARNDTRYGGWGGQPYTCATPTDLDVASMSLREGVTVRVVIVWDQNPAYTYYSSKPSADLDLQVFSAAGVRVAASHRWDNTYEIVEFTPASTGTYTLQVDKPRCDLTPGYLGWAWSQP